jgi:hypothetical protein
MYSGYAPTNHMAFQTSLFWNDSLPNTDHTLILTNKGDKPQRSWVDVDFIVYTVADGRKDGTIVKTSRMDDADTRLSWSDGWRTDQDVSFGWSNTQQYVP